MMQMPDSTGPANAIKCGKQDVTVFPGGNDYQGLI